jgi:hypothetical protein
MGSLVSMLTYAVPGATRALLRHNHGITGTDASASLRCSD